MKLVLSKKHLILVLWLLNIFTAIVAFALAYSANFPDETGYLDMRDGLSHGRFSSWYLLDHYYPETLRTPGYPLFLFLIGYISKAKWFIGLIQFPLYFMALALAYNLVKKLSEDNPNVKAIFLTLTALNIQIPYYAGCVSPDLLCIFCTILYAYILIVKPRTLGYAVMAGLVAGVSYLMRPSFMLFPFFITVYTLLFQRSELRYSLVHAGVVALMLLPFSYWNYVNHGVFKPTPLEGGGGVAHIGYWRFKLPRNYVERFYWSNTTEYDCTEPFRLSDEERHKGQIAFEKEWTEILARLDTCHSAEDKIQLKYMAAATPGKFKLYNSQFTRGREHLLWEKTLMHAREDPWFYFKTRIYTLCRSYYTGISYNNWVVSTSMVSRIKTVYPFMVTFFCIFIGLCISTIYVFRVKSEGLLILWSIAAYQGVVHMFFTIQARYIVPVHFTVLILLSLTLGSWIATRRQKNLTRI